MEFFKIFPSLLLDLISKFLPGSVFLLVFRSRYLPPTELVLQLFEPPVLSAELRSYGSIGVFVISSYLIGVFIALTSNAVDAWRNMTFWQPRIQRSPSDYFFAAEQPQSFTSILASPKGFGRFVDYCRTSVSASTSGLAFALEKYRTVYRLFFAFLVLSILLPFYMPSPQGVYALPTIPLLLWLSHMMQKHYLLKSVQLFALHERGVSKPKDKEPD